MEFIHVESSTVDQVAYDESAREAHVIFKNSAHYIYSNVSLNVWRELVNSSSKGKFINDEFKKKAYPCRKVYN